MKKYIIKSVATLTLLTSLVSCNSNENVNAINVPTANEFANIRNNALQNLTQNFQINADGSMATITSTNGVQVDISTNCLTLNGNIVTGTVNIEYVELFNGGQMLVTHKTTMGKLPNNDMAILQSGGEFYINATQNGQQLTLTCSMNARIPSDLTAPETDMLLWDGIEDADGNMDWIEQDNAPGIGGVTLGHGAAGQGVYYAALSSFGWTNVDRFISYSGLKTEILATVPSGYDNENCAIYLHYDGEGNALASLDTYNTGTGLFSEHYGQIPVGLACHIIFATEDNGQWRYAIKAVIISENAVYGFTLSETIVGSEAQLIAAINALP